MKTLLVGDTHLMARIILLKVREVIKELNVKRIILMGDYTDQWGCVDFDGCYKDDLRFLYRWKQEMVSQGVEVVMLAGNHDVPYLIDKQVSYSVANLFTFEWVKQLLYDLELQIAYRLDDVLVSHAGYTEDYEPMKWHFETIISKFKDKLDELHNHIGLSRGGRYITGSPIWADFRRDMTDYYHKDYPKQIVGHSWVESITLDQDIIGIDTFSLDTNYKPLGNGDMLLYENGNLIVIEFPEWRSREYQNKRIECFEKSSCFQNGNN